MWYSRLVFIRANPNQGNYPKYRYLIFTPLSWMMKGIIDFLLSDSSEAKLLRENIVFKIVPMLNMDGVIEGNHRCSLASVDLNRQWLYPSPTEHPTIYSTKKLILHIQQTNEILMFVDLHGHFRKKNIFMYGCNNDQDSSLRHRECIVPYLLSQLDPNFSYEDSSYKITQAKRSCGRVVVGKDLKVLRSYTMEASFSGMSSGPNKDFHLNIGMLEDVGKHLCQVLTFFVDPSSQQKVEETYQLLISMKELTNNPSESEDTKGAKKKPRKKIIKKKN